MLLFCYGSLEFAEVMREITGRSFAGEPATLDGFARYRVRDTDYPGLVPESDAQTVGTLFRALDAVAIAALDRFEGALYERKTLDVRLRGGTTAARSTSCANHSGTRSRASRGTSRRSRAITSPASCSACAARGRRSCGSSRRRARSSPASSRASRRTG